MALMRTHIDFSTFLNYHGTTTTDPLLFNYISAFDNFCKFQADHYFQSANEAFIKWNLQHNTTPMLLTPTFPSQTMATSNTLPVVVSSTSTSTTTLVNENNTNQIEQITEEYLDDDLRHMLKPIDNFPSLVIVIHINLTPTGITIFPPPTRSGESL
jgi:hypothetical protein